MATGADRQEDLEQARTRQQQDIERRKAIAQRAWEGGEIPVTQIAQAASADPKTVKRWAKQGGWKGGPAGRDAVRSIGSDGPASHVRSAMRSSGRILEEDTGR